MADLPGLRGSVRSARSPSRANSRRTSSRPSRDPVSIPRALPEELRYAVVDGTPRPRIRVGRPERQNPYALRQDLRATVQFEYAGVVVQGPPGAAAYDATNRRLDAARPRRRAGRHRSASPARVPVHLEPFRIAAAPRNFARAVPTRRPHAGQRRLARRSRRADLPVCESMRFEVRRGSTGSSCTGRSISATAGRPLAAAARRRRTRRRRSCSTTGRGARCRKNGCGAAPASPASARRRRRSRPLQRSQVALLDALLAAQPAITFDETFAQLAIELRTVQRHHAARPAASFAGTLRDYQRDALGWFAFLRRFGFGGCLADDMGLGKTVMVLALLDARRQAPRPRRARPVARRRAALARLQLERRGRAVRAGAAGARLQRRRCAIRRRRPTGTTSCSPPTARCGATRCC